MTPSVYSVIKSSHGLGTNHICWWFTLSSAQRPDFNIRLCSLWAHGDVVPGHVDLQLLGQRFNTQISMLLSYMVTRDGSGRGAGPFFLFFFFFHSVYSSY